MQMWNERFDIMLYYRELKLRKISDTTNKMQISIALIKSGDNRFPIMVLISNVREPIETIQTSGFSL